jgi:formamidopyrimidine-DNA glycosylase
VPELPEVETVRRDLEATVTGRSVIEVQVTGGRSIRRHRSPDDFASRVEGHRILRAGRHGKYLLLSLDGGDVMVVHLGMSGQLLTATPDTPVQPHTHVVLRFDSGSPGVSGPNELRFVDPRTFGEIFVGPALGNGRPAELSHLGIDPITEQISAARLGKLLAGRRTRIKPLLLDQRRVAGIGNIYADEMLFEARLRYDRVAAGLSVAEVRRLHRAMVSILAEAIVHRGSSLVDRQYRDLDGRTGDYQNRHRAYGREGLDCDRCRTRIERVTIAGRSAFFCPRCQA